MSQMLGLDFISKYNDYKKVCPKCGSEDLEAISTSDNELDVSQFCKRCNWNRKVYHKYCKENAERLSQLEESIKLLDESKDSLEDFKKQIRQDKLDFLNQMKKSDEEFKKKMDKMVIGINKEPIFDWSRRKSTL